ncbi:MAG: transcriptional regulator [Xanthobacter sp. 17-67-6]|jgi:DNA-binding HxlR family transcriptional regulator|uniref:winged helix-turn-helix transcriptional regulator n=1 Tax=Xanthobacter flavus TaxID=281 RepID=UPI000BD2EDE0|nr:MAG: transcriptional regulator [Xanthobacter sp. 17-67-6]OZA86379.1 MAG: transcriptional regulator [Azorhizobium sp. 39-67-5]
MPGKTDLATFNCSLARALNDVGDWWTLLIIRDAFLGAQRFSEFQRSLGMARNILSDRLERLCAAGVLLRGGALARPIYSLTEKGRALAPALVALQQWGDQFASENRPPVVVTDQRGRRLPRVKLVDSDGAEVGPEDLRFRPGPGADERTRARFQAVKSVRKVLK